VELKTSAQESISNVGNTISTEVKKHPKLATLAVAGVAFLGAAEQATGGNSAVERTNTNGDAQVSAVGKVSTWTKGLSNKKIINKIHDNILPQVEFKYRGIKNPVTVAYVKASEGSFKTNCRLPNKSVLQNGFYLRSFKIDTKSVAFKQCGIPTGSVWEGPIKINEFKEPLNNLGNTILNRSRVPADMQVPNRQNVNFVGGSRKKMKVKLECPEPTADINVSEPTGVKEILLTKRGKKATITPCPE